MAMKRLVSEYKQHQKDPNYFYSVCPDENNFMKWNFTMIGPPESLYEYGMFSGFIVFPKTYPIKPPTVKTKLIAKSPKSKCNLSNESTH